MQPIDETLTGESEGTAQSGDARGRLKVFLGYASGIGKSRKMLDEGRRRKERGQDVVVGATQPETPPDVEALLRYLEVIPMKVIQRIPAMDLDAILARRPRICIVDGLAYDNPPGSRNAHRWQDAEELLAAGITVITSVNIQYIDRQQRGVEKITGKHVTESVPQEFLITADEIELVDAPLAMAGQAGAAGQQVEAAKLTALRQLALVLAADVVDASLRRYLDEHGIQQTWGTQERILVYVTPDADATKMIESGRRNVRRFHGDLNVAWVQPARSKLTPEQSALLGQNLSLARASGAHIEALRGDDPAQAIAAYARQQRITQIFLGYKAAPNWRTRLFGTPVSRLARTLPEIDVRVFPV